MTSHIATCRFNGTVLTETFADLGMSPLANSYLMSDEANRSEQFFPLHAYVSSDNFLVQLEQFETPENIFGDYAYFSSFSESWLLHAKTYTEHMIARFGFNADSHVVEIASNDGYLLQYFQERGIPVLGVEPAANVAEHAVAKGIPSEVVFFGTDSARILTKQHGKADLLLGNNVLAHVPDLNDFIGGIKVMLADDGVLTMEFPHLLKLMDHNQFDTIYHEHFSYFSFSTVERIFAAHGITLFDVEELATHGGSLRIYGKHAGDETHAISPRTEALKNKEMSAGLLKMDTYLAFGERVKATKRELLRFIIDAKDEGKSIVGYGAPAKGNTLLNYCGIRTDMLDYTVDLSPHKQGRLLPGVHIPIHAPEMIRDTKPDYVLILPWNLKDEISNQMSYIREWGGQFVVPIPGVSVF